MLRLTPDLARYRFVPHDLTEVVADGAYLINRAIRGGSVPGAQLDASLQSLFEHAGQRIEVGVILISDIIAQSR